MKNKEKTQVVLIKINNIEYWLSIDKENNQIE